MNWYSGSLLYPPVVNEGAVADPPANCLLDIKLFVGDRTNATTAWYDPPEDDEMSIQVTLFVAPPPRVSCILAWCTQTYFTEQPKIVSTHDGLVLLCIAFSKKSSRSPEYYMYQPFSDPGDDDDRLLELIPQPSDCSLAEERCTVGLLSSHSGSGGYHMAVLTMSMQATARGVFDLYVFSSETKTWTVKKPTFSFPVDVDFEDFMADKAIPLVGGFMAFVDYYKGILICDVLNGGESPELHFLPLPSEELCQPLPDAYPSKPHDLTITISSDTIRLKFAKVVCPLLSGGWRTDTWIATTTATSPWRQPLPWQHYSTVNDRQLSVPANIDLSGLLDHGTIGSLFVEKPMLSLHEDNIVCFMAKRDIMERQVWVIAVDMVKQELQGVILLGAGRVTKLIYSTISGHLNNNAAAASNVVKGDLKRLGAWLESHPHKKPQQLSTIASLVGEEERGVMETDDGDDMDLELK